MRTILLAGAAVLALGLGSAYADQANHNGQNGNSGSGFAGNNSGNTSTSSKSSSSSSTDLKVSVPITASQVGTSASANATNGSEAAAGHGVNANLSNVGNSSDSRNQSSTATNGSASATNGGTADSTDVSTGAIAVLDACNCQLAYGDLSTTDSHERITTTITTNLAHANNGGTVNGATVVTVLPVAGMDNVMNGSVNGQGILTAQQNTGANVLQQNAVALGSIVGGNGGGLNGLHQ